MRKDFESVFEIVGPYIVMWVVALFVFVFLASRFLPGPLRGLISAAALLYAAHFSQSLGSEWEIYLFATYVPLVLTGLAVPFFIWGVVDVVRTLMGLFKKDNAL